MSYEISPTGKMRATTHQPLDTLSHADLQRLREIIGQVIENGDDGGYWKFHLGQHDIHIKAVTKADLDAVCNRFIETIIARLTRTAAPATVSTNAKGDHQ